MNEKPKQKHEIPLVDPYKSINKSLMIHYLCSTIARSTITKHGIKAVEWLQ